MAEEFLYGGKTLKQPEGKKQEKGDYKLGAEQETSFVPEVKKESQQSKSNEYKTGQELETSFTPEVKKEKTEQEKSQLFIYRMTSGNLKAEEAPADFQMSEKIKTSSESFYAAREKLLDAFSREYKARAIFKKSGGEKGGQEAAEAEIWRENAEKEHERLLGKLKKEFLNDFLKRKKEQYPKLTKKELQEEALRYSAKFILETAKDIDMSLEAEKAKRAYEAKERGLVGSLWAKYIKAPRHVRWLISAGIAAGVGGVSALALGPGGLIVAGAYAGHRGLRSLGGMVLGGGLQSLIEKGYIRKKYGKQRMEIRQEQYEATLAKLREEVKEVESWLDSEKKKLKLMEIVDKDAVEYRQKLDEVARREGKTRMKSALISGLIGGAAAAGVDWYYSLKTGPGAVPPPVLPGKSTEGIISGIESAKKGDSVWKLAERQLEHRMGLKFTSLNEAQKTSVVAVIKNMVAADLEKFGLTNVDQIKIGQKIDFSEIFKDQAGMEDVFKKALSLHQGQMENIVHNNEVLRNWRAAHPTELFTSEKVEEILSGGGAKTTLPVTEALPGAESKIPPVTEAVAGETPKVPPVTEAVAGGTPKVPVTEAIGGETLFGSNIEETIAGSRLGFNPGEYRAISKITVGKLLDEIPSKELAWKIREGMTDLYPGKKIDLPFTGYQYTDVEFTKHVRLADFVRSFNPDSEMQKLSVSSFLKLLEKRI